MIIGLNRIREHEGRQFHIQVEDLGLQDSSFEVRVYEAGTVLWHKRVSYTEVLDPALSKEDQNDAVRGLMEKMLHTVEAAISRGKLLG